MVTVGTTPSGFGNGVLGLMSELLALAESPTGTVTIALCEKLNAASLTMLGRMMLTECSTTPRPGELVWVMAILGTLDWLNRPPDSVVGMSSMVTRPQRLNRSLIRWSMRNISWRLLKMFLTGKKPAVVAAVVVPSGSGSLLTMSLIYAAAFALIRLAGICVTGAEPVGQPVVLVMQTGWSRVPVSIPLVGSTGLN